MQTVYSKQNTKVRTRIMSCQLRAKKLPKRIVKYKHNANRYNNVQTTRKRIIQEAPELLRSPECICNERVYSF